MTTMIRVKIKTFLGIFPGLDSILKVLEPTDMYAFSAKIYVCMPSLARSVPRNPMNSASVICAYSDIAKIDRRRRFTKIGPAVVQSITINVVNLIRWPSSLHNRESNSVSQKHHPHKVPISVGSVYAGKGFFTFKTDLEYLIRSFRREKFTRPRKSINSPGLRFVTEQLAAQFGRDIGAVSHLAVPSRWWLGRRSGCNPFAARSYHKNAGLLQENRGGAGVLWPA